MKAWLIALLLLAGAADVWRNVAMPKGAPVVPLPAPLVLYTDFVDGPVAGGENNLGGYLSVFGVNFGAFADLGTVAGARVFIGGQEVANYRVLDTAVTTQNGFPVTVQRLVCQVGSAGVQGLALGTAYAVSVQVNGVASNASDLDGNSLLFTPVSAPIVFVDEANGLESNAGTMAAPKQFLQTFTSGNMSGACASNTSVSGGSSNGVQAGTLFVLRGGTWAHVVSHGNRWVDLFRVTGCDPAATPTGGAKGTNAGYLKFVAYPGPVLGNAPEAVVYQQPAQGANGGGFNGNDTARAQEVNPYGATGYAQYVAISGLKIALDPGTGSDAAPVNLQTSAKFWRVVNCDLSYPSTVAGAGHAKAGGVSGDGAGAVVCGNYIHDVGCDPAFNENHGVYMDANLIYTRNFVVAYNHIKNITGGSGVQQYSQVISPPDADGFGGFTGQSVHHNWIDTPKKYGLNLADNSLSGKWWGNVVLHAGLYPLRLNTNSASLALTVMNNTFYDGCTTKAGLNAMVSNEWNATSGTVELKDNAFVMGAARANNPLAWYANNATDSALAWTNNLWFDPDGVTTAAPSGAGHTGEIYGDPKFSVPYTAFSLLASSPAIGAAAISINLTVTRDFALGPQPRAGQTVNSIGAYA